MLRALLAILLCVAVQAATMSTTLADGGALAVVPKQGKRFHGFASGGTKSANKSRALAECGNKKCILIQEYRKGQCAVIVLGRQQIFWNNRQYANQRADIMAFCNAEDSGCREIRYECF